MKFNFSRSMLFAVSALVLSSCGKDEDKKESGKGSYPDIYTATKLVVPSFTTTALNVSDLGNGGFYRLAGAVPSITTNFGTSTDWSAVNSASNNSIGQLLRDAGTGGTIKSLWTLIAGTQGTMQSINTDFSDENGEPKNCAGTLNSTNTLKAPYWDTATGAIVSISDAGKYTCYIQPGENAITAFGRHAVSNPPSTCTDAFEYYVLSTYSATGTPIASGDSSYGTSSDAAGSSKFYYNGCSKELKLMIASRTKYSGGTEFSLRTEVSGNTGTSNFTMRSAWVDITSSGGGMASSIVASGTTFKVNNTDGLFLIGNLASNCPTSTSCTTFTGDFNYCIQNTGSTSTTMGVASSNATCTASTSLAQTYASLTPISDTTGTAAGIPRAQFVASKATMNLP